MRIKTALVLGLLLAFTAACGGEDDDGGVATAGDATEESTEDQEASGDDDAFEQALAYSQCMRDNGVGDFPDPELTDDGGISLSVDTDADQTTFQAAEEACEELMPGFGDDMGDGVDPESLEAMREYSQCMRDNGIEGFPDPTADGGIMIDGDELGVDPTGPEMQAAEEVCGDMMSGGPGGGGGSEIGEDE